MYKIENGDQPCSPKTMKNTGNADPHTATNPNENVQTYLTLGEGDFSWSVDLSKHLSELSARTTGVYSSRLLATGFDAKDDLLKKYLDFDCTLKRICRMQSDRFQVQIEHGVNAIIGNKNSATIISSSELINNRKANFVFFNHPHLGTEDAALHGYFLYHLFDSVRTIWMAASGLFVLTLVDGQYERWQCQEAAQKHRFRLLERYRFVPNAIENSVYELRRHQTGKSFRTRTGGSYSFVFARIEDTAPPIEVMSDLPWFQNTKEMTSNRTGKPEDRRIDVLFSCPHCDRTFREERSVENHILSKHQNGKKRNLECTFCKEPRVFDSEASLRDHQQAKHRGIHGTILPDWVGNSKPEYYPALGQCLVCGCKFTPYFGTDEHFASFLPQPQKQIPCRFCMKIFGSERAKNQHENYCSQVRHTQSSL